MILKKIDKSGVASIPLVMGLLILIISVGLFISSISLSDSLSSSNQEKGNLALEYAKIGAQEALVGISRMPCDQCGNNFQLEMVSGGCSGNINGCVNVSYTPATFPTSSEIVINSEAEISTIVKRVQVNANLDSYGKIVSYNWQ
ncbi:MAG: hypothetical protein ACOYL8_00590 [Patescibacteria group bacterium]